MTLPAIDFRRTTQPATRYPFLWRARDLSINALSGQAGTYGSTAGESITDSFGNSVTLVYNMPPWDDYANAGLGVEPNWIFGGTSNVSLSWPLGTLIPQAMCGMIEFSELLHGNFETSSAGVWEISDGGGSGARIYIAVTASGTKYYELVYTADGSTFRRSTMAVATTAQVKVRLRWQLTSAGVANLWQSIDGGAEVAGSTPSASALPAAWSGTTMRINRAGASSYGVGRYRNVVLMMGNQTSTVLASAIT